MSFKRAAMLVSTWLTVIFATTQARAGETVLGLRAGYNTRSSAPLAGLVFQYRFSEYLRLSPDIDYYFRHNNTDALSIDCNVHIPFSLTPANRIALYPFAGLNYTSWNYHNSVITTPGYDDVSTRTNRFGINLGGGFEYYATPTLKLSFEAKAALIKSYSSGTFSASIAYVF